MRRLKKEQTTRKTETALTLSDEESLRGEIPLSDIDSTLAARHALVEALSRLPAKQRIALALRYVHDPKAIQQFMGHSKIQTTFDVYGHLLPGSHDEVRQRMDLYLQGG